MKLFTRRKILVNTAAACSAAVISSLPNQSISAFADEVTTHKVEIRKFKFFPEKLSVKPGDTIEFTNFDIVPHTATADDKSWGTGKLKKGQSKGIAVTDAMFAQYFCRFHPHMKAGLQIE